MRLMNESSIFVDTKIILNKLEALVSSLSGVFISEGFEEVSIPNLHMNAKNLSTQVLFSDSSSVYYIGLDFEPGLLDGENGISLWATRIENEGDNVSKFLENNLDSSCYDEILVSILPVNEDKICKVAKQLIILIQNNCYQ